MGNEDLIKQLEAKKQDILDKAEKDIEQLDATIHTLRYLSTAYIPSSSDTGSKSGLSDKYQDFNPKWQMRDKVAFILKTENRFLNLKQIGEILHKLEPKVSVEDHIGKLYTPIGVLKNEGKVFKYKLGSSNANSFWGSVNWVTGTGEIKEGYKYDEDRVVVYGQKGEVEI